MGRRSQKTRETHANGAQTERKKPRGKPFAGKDDPRNSAAVNAAMRNAAPPLSGAAATLANPAEVRLVPSPADLQRTLFEDMQWVCSHPPEDDWTLAQREVRRWKEEALPAFMARFAEMQARAGSGQDDDEAVDQGEERCLALLDEALARYDAEEASEEKRKATAVRQEREGCALVADEVAQNLILPPEAREAAALVRDRIRAREMPAEPPVLGGQAAAGNP